MPAPGRAPSAAAPVPACSSLRRNASGRSSCGWSAMMLLLGSVRVFAPRLVAAQAFFGSIILASVDRILLLEYGDQLFRGAARCTRDREDARLAPSHFFRRR